MATGTSNRADAYSYPAQPSIRDPQRQLGPQHQLGPEHQLPARVPRRIEIQTALPVAGAVLALSAAGAAAAYLLKRKQQQENTLRARLLRTLNKGYDSASRLAGKASSKAADLAAHEGRDLAIGVVSTGTHLAHQGSKLAAKTAGNVRDFAEEQGPKVLKRGQAVAEEGSKAAAKGYRIGKHAAEDTVHAARKQSKAVFPLLVGLALAAAVAYVERLASKPSVFSSNGHESTESESTVKSAPKRKTTARRRTSARSSTARKSASKSE